MTLPIRSLFISALLLPACGGSAGDPAGGPDGAVSQADAAAGAAQPDAAPVEIDCDEPPHLMIVLDRSGSFARRPDGTLPANTADGKQQTRWHIAIAAIENMAAALEDELQFGLALFPFDPDGAGGRDCSNLDTWLAQYLPPESNDLACQQGEVKVSPAATNAAAIDEAIDLDTTGLCSFTPIGAGLAAAQGELTAIADPDIEQYAILITDGADTCDGDAGYATDSLATADAMAAAGIDLYVVGFDGTGEDLEPAHLNDLACAGHTAPDFASNCQEVGGGFRAVAAPNPGRLYYLATELGSLQAALMAISADVCDGEE
jgi:hypothetical protein